jgi:uncharacterized protein (TIGR03067 family)
MRPIGLIVFIFGSAALVQAGNDKTGDLDRIQGAWQIVALVEKGKKVPDEDTKDLEIVVAGDRLGIRAKGKAVAEYTVKLDEKQKPRAMDMTITDGDDKGKVAPGIYNLEGDTLKIAMDEEFKNRPKSFDEKDTATCSVIALKRKKKD